MSIIKRSVTVTARTDTDLGSAVALLEAGQSAMADGTNNAEAIGAFDRAADLLNKLVADLATKLADGGMSTHEIARRSGVPQTTIAHRIRRHRETD